ncbi:hypothetical protein J6590_056067 [Homalodisca vitripennis]|nr:hypothetical protein J6590_056067 [Homalodisca vitripennis]
MSTTGVGGLRDVEIRAPLAVPPGSSATLTCKYDLEGDPLYTVKWYKGRQEFFRYVPKELPHTRVFPLPGVNVDPSYILCSSHTPQATPPFTHHIPPSSKSLTFVPKHARLSILLLSKRYRSVSREAEKRSGPGGTVRHPSGVEQNRDSAGSERPAISKAITM